MSINEETAWKTTISEGTPEAYAKFAENFPNSIRAQVAKNRITEYKQTKNQIIYLVTNVVNIIWDVITRIGDYWFRQYNPLYFISAACVLYGVLLISTDFSMNVGLTLQFSLFLVITLYQLSLIGSARLLLWAPEQKRSAVFLGFLALIFIFDPTFTVEIFYRINGLSWLLFLWWILGVIQYLLLGKVFTLNHAYYLYNVGIIYLSLILFNPWLRSNLGLEHNLFYISLVWIGIILWIARCLFTPVQYTISVQENYKILANRSIKTVWTLQFGLFNFHIIPIFFLFNNYSDEIINTRILAVLVPSFVVILFNIGDNLVKFFNQETLNKIRVIISLISIYVTFFSPKLAALNSIGAATSISIAIRGNYLPTNYLLVVIGFLYIAIWTWGWDNYPLPEHPSTFINILFAFILIILGLWQRQRWLLIAVAGAILWKLRNIIFNIIEFFYNLFNKIIAIIDYIFTGIIHILKTIIIFISDNIVKIFHFIIDIFNEIIKIVNYIFTGIIHTLKTITVFISDSIVKIFHFIIDIFNEIIELVIYLISNVGNLPTKYKGAILLLIGFISLLVGVLINLKQSRRSNNTLDLNNNSGETNRLN